MNKKLLRIIQLSFWSMIIVIFLLSVYTLLNTNINSLLDKNRWEFIGNIANVLSLVGIVITAFVLFPSSTLKKIQNKLLHETFPNDGSQLAQLKNYDALMFTVSNAGMPLWMMRTYQPKAIGLIGTNISADNIRKITDYADEQGIKHFARILENPDAVARTKEESQEIINKLKEAGYTSIAFDITGGKIPMSIGAFSAAEDNRLDSLYITAEYDEKGPIASTVNPLLLSSGHAKS